MFKQLTGKKALSQSLLLSAILVCITIFFLAGCDSNYTLTGSTTNGNGHQGQGSTSSGGSGSTQTTGSGSTTAPSQIVVTANEGQGLVQQYYDDINKQDFQDAYKLWGTDFQQKSSYNQFVAGFHYLVSDALQVNSSQTSTDGNCSVDVTVTSREQPSTGPTIFTTYTGTYIVGRQNGTDVLLTANLQKVS